MPTSTDVDWKMGGVEPLLGRLVLEYRSCAPSNKPMPSSVCWTRNRPTSVNTCTQFQRGTKLALRGARRCRRFPPVRRVGALLMRLVFVGLSFCPPTSMRRR
jgi:hypothetical protein